MGLAAGCMFASMRFFANGPSIPDELLVSRDEGDVGSYPWDGTEGERHKEIAYERLNKLHWLSTHDVVFGFDVETMKATLKRDAPEWVTQAGDAAAESRAPVVFNVERNENAEALVEIPIADILGAAQEASRYDYIGHVQREPFRGLSTRRPSRALSALTHAARKGLAPRWAWSEFLHADGRAKDGRRMVGVITHRLARLLANLLVEIARPVSDWMESTADRLYADAGNGLASLWDRLVGALAAGESEARRRRRDRSWADEALNAPVGKLWNFLAKDPRKDELQRGAGFPPRWTSRTSQLLTLPGDLRRQALVMIASQTAWLFTIDPTWTERDLLPAAADEGDDGDAFWDGVLWTARIPSPQLFLELKRGIMARAIREGARRQHDTALAGLLLGGWGRGADDDAPNGLVTDVELREVLIHADEGLRAQILWQLSRWASGPGSDERWREKMVPFLKNVWPKQRPLRTSALSGRLATLAMASGDLMPEIVELILPRLVPARNVLFNTLNANAGAEEYPTRRYPKAVLDLLWAVLAEDPTLWPHGADGMIARLGQDPLTAGDPRLSELRRRRER
jgi:hypothetical protein